MWWRVHLAKAVVPGWSCRLVAETSRQRGDPGDGFAGWWRVSLAGMVLGEWALPRSGGNLSEEVSRVSQTARIVKAMPTFTREEIEHLGDLARIALTDEEITRLQGDLNVIAESINKVQEVASDDVPPTANPIPLEAYLRPDVPETPLTQAEALAGGPKTADGMFLAPRILGSEE